LWPARRHLRPDPAHSHFEQGTGHHHEEIEEIYLLTRGALTMHFLDTRDDRAPAAVRVAPGTTRSHFNERDEDVEMWAISRQLGRPDATKVDDLGGLARRALVRRSAYSRPRR
jgi:hypothetical protein